PSQRALVQEALADWRQSLGTRLDFPETHLVTGGMALTMRNIPAATAAFRQVVALDPQRVEAWSMLVRLAEATEGPEAARRVLREALALVPDDPGLAEMRRQLGI
ncbi:MAG: tetratricopeptide repeat protein, partial [Sedimentitalea sp.]|nr:tetratricopeptide repeat protein [Sedimentitalea sp.]